MNPKTRHEPEGPDDIAVGPIAVLGVLMGAVFALSGIAGQDPVFGAMARMYHEKPSLTAGETFWLGAVVLAASLGVIAWHRLAKSRRR